MRSVNISFIGFVIALSTFVAAAPLEGRADPELPESATLIVKNAAGDAIAFAANDGRFLPLPNSAEASLIKEYAVSRVFENFPGIGLRATLSFGSEPEDVCTTTFPEDLLVCGADKDADAEGFFVFAPTFEGGVWEFGTAFGLTLVDQGESRFFRLHHVEDNEVVDDGDKVTLTLA